MDKSMSIDLYPSDLQFSVFSGEEIKKISVVRVITGLTFDPFGQPLPGGLYDSLMGTSGKRADACTTCRASHKCSGHIGHIELSALVFNPFFTKLAQRILSISCLKCFKLQKTEHLLRITELQLRLIDAGYIIEAQELELYKSEVALHSGLTILKEDEGEVVNSHILELKKLVTESKQNDYHNTKSSCAVRTAIVNSVLERPASTKCIHCSKPLINVKYMYRKLVFYMTASQVREKLNDQNLKTGNYKAVFADECRKYLRQIYENHPTFLELLFPILKTTKSSKMYSTSPVDLFFMDTVVVTPPKARPIGFAAGKILEHSQTNIYRRIIENNSVLRIIMSHAKGENVDATVEAKNIYEKSQGSSQYEKFYNAWQELQSSVDVLLDVNLAREKVSTLGLKQVIEKKDGLLRKHMMGKRVNFAARTVITPDPNINVDEVGIPDVFARKISYPVPVTPWNVAKLRKMVINGPDVHPGANLIENEKGSITLIPRNDPAKRESMAKLLFSLNPENGVKIVHRHIVNGDVLLLNRQPSLHRASIMAHKVRILPGERTFRLHYSNCKAYNADFDGDEMNAHFPQSEVARAEAYNLVNVANHYLVPKDGTPLGGLIQDHVIAGVKLSLRGRFFNREDYHQLVYQGLANKKGNIKFLPPTIIKPRMLWSGKQILSTIIMNSIPDERPKINLYTVSKIQAKNWLTERPRTKAIDEMCESKVTIRNGELLVGVLDKQQYGATTFGLIHCIYELYGGEVSTDVLTAFTKVFTSFLQREGFTLGVKDILVTSVADVQRRNIVKECREVGTLIMADALELDEIPTLDVLAEKMKEAYKKDPKFRVVLDRKYKSALDEYTNNINSVCLPKGLITPFPDNNLQLMILSGAKGSLVNAMQISSLLGQIELEGKRPPLMISGKSLPSFAIFETSPKSGGFIDGRFMTGIQPQDFFFHCMAGREGLIDTAVKTSRSGYLQRCLIKHLEGLTVNYDLTVRDCDNSVVQFLYGEDGLDILKSKFFSNSFGPKFFMLNSGAILNTKEFALIKDDESLSKIKRHLKSLRSWRKINEKLCDDTKKYRSAFTNFSSELRDEVETKNPNKISSKTGRRRLDEGIIKLWKKADAAQKELYKQNFKRCPDTVVSLYKPDCYYGAVPESIQQQIDSNKSFKKNGNLADILYIKSMKALAAPGEPVGLLAAQSIGEPSTQMTLNTFHFAGRGEMNVTLGIPRLREILMLASSNIKTPSMDIPIVPGKLRSADKLRIKLNRVTLANVLQHVDVSIKLVLKPERTNQYQLRFQFLPREVYQDDFCVKPKQIIKFVSENFLKQLFVSLIRTGKSKSKILEIGDTKEKSDEQGEADDDGEDVMTKTRSNDNDNDKDSSDEEGNIDDNDATGIKLKSRKQDETEYDDPEDNEEIEDANFEDEDVVIVANPESKVEIEEESEDKMVDAVLKNSMVQDYTYDKENYLWCKLTFHLNLKYKTTRIYSVIRELAEKSVLHQVQNIKRSIIYKGANDEQYIKTDGINIVEMFKHTNILNVNRLYANDIHAIAKTYGIEAAARVIVKEVSNVFNVYGINVDRRHLSLIADYMTFDGSFQPLSRKGMEHSSSPLQQMSFESSLQFLKSATQSGRNDELNSPSGRLMVGLPIRNGTGAFDLLTKIC